MMGDYCIYCYGIIFGLICDNNLFIKVTDPLRILLFQLKSHKFTPIIRALKA
ncbi:MAG: TfoX/Sxy family protein [Bacteroidales bacterium]|nr:TfoX/Sxy family protein [Bacteroidales bacterium]